MRMVSLFSLLVALGYPVLAAAQTAPLQPPPPAPVAPIQQAPVAPPPAVWPQQAAPVAPVYPPPAYAYQLQAQRAALSAEIAAINTRLMVLQRERSQHSVGGPIGMLAAGFGTALLFTTVGLVQWSVAEEIERGDFEAYNNRAESDYGFYEYDQRYDLNEDGLVNHRDERQARRVARTFAGLTAVSTGVGIAGAVLLSKALARRRVYDPEIRALRARRSEVARSLQYSGGFSRNSLSLTISAHF